MPSSPRGFLSWAIYTLDAQGRPFSPSYEYTGQTDPRMRYSREDALTIKIAAERASHKISGNGIGYALLLRFYVAESSWFSFSKREQAILRKTAREFSRRLISAGFIEGKDAGRGEIV